MTRMLIAMNNCWLSVESSHSRSPIARRYSEGLSPAYDLNYMYDIGYFNPDEYRSLSIRAKRSHITRKDVTEFARDNGIQNPDAVIQDVATALKQFRAVALKNEVSDGWIESVEQTLMSHLKEWNEFEDYFSIICS